MAHIVAMSRADAGNAPRLWGTSAALSDQEQVLAENDTKFLTAVWEGAVDKILELLGKGQEINVGNANEESTIHVALNGMLDRARKAPTAEASEAIYKDRKLIDTLVGKGAFPDYKDKAGRKPLHVCFDALDIGVPMCDALLKYVDANNSRVVDLAYLRTQDKKKDNTLLHDACWAGNTGCTALLLATKEFPDLERRNAEGQTALHIAAFRGGKVLAKTLVDAGAKVDTKEENKRRLSKDSAIEMAEESGHEDTADLLRSMAGTATAVLAAGRLKKKLGQKATGSAA
jgi:ankyrin repeat protein